MKKSLSILAIAAIVFLGVVGALAVVPHTHGNDFDHSKHATCPVYQFSLQGFNAVFTSFSIATVLFQFCYFVSLKKNSFLRSYLSFVSSRAPPALI